MAGQILRVPHGTRPTSDAMAVFLSELLHATAQEADRAERGYWINFHSDYLRSTVGGRYASVVREANKLKYVEVNGCYKAGEYPKSYRLTSEFRRPQSSEYVLKVARSRGQVRIDTSDAVTTQLAGHFFSAEIPPGIQPKGWGGFCAESLARREWYARRCQYGRLHSTFTGLPKPVRRRLLLDGQPVVEIDIANCQALFIGLLAQNYFLNLNTQEGERGVKGEGEGEGEAGGRGGLSSAPFPMAHNSAKMGGVNDGGFLDEASRGVLYESILRRCEGRTLFEFISPEYRHLYHRDRPLRRGDIKRQFMVLSFGTVEEMVKMPLFDVVAGGYPPIADFMVATKRDDYRSLAKQCQTDESRIMIDKVARTLACQFPVITIHDSIIAPQQHADAVEGEIKRRFLELGLAVTVKRSPDLR